MIWIFPIVVLLFLLFVPALRAIALGFIISIVALGLIWYWLSRGELTTRNKIRLSEVEFTNLRLDSVKSTLMGQIKNNSPRYTLTGIGIRITMQDCAPEGVTGKIKCKTVGEGTEQLNLNIPPRQVREINEFVSLPANLGAIASPSLNYSIQYIEGR